MPNRVDFYLLKNASPNIMALTACRISEKAYKQGHKIYLLTESPTQKESLNALLWTFQEISFVPHALWEGKLAEDIPVYVGATDTSSLPFQDILINLTQEIPSYYNNFQRVIEIVADQPDTREKAREKFRYYRQQQCNLHSHHL